MFVSEFFNATSQRNDNGFFEKKKEVVSSPNLEGQRVLRVQTVRKTNHSAEHSRAAESK
jgi:hypothetical protein